MYWTRWTCAVWKACIECSQYFYLLFIVISRIFKVKFKPAWREILGWYELQALSVHCESKFYTEKIQSLESKVISLMSKAKSKVFKGLKDYVEFKNTLWWLTTVIPERVIISPRILFNHFGCLKINSCGLRRRNSPHQAFGSKKRQQGRFWIKLFLFSGFLCWLTHSAMLIGWAWLGRGTDRSPLRLLFPPGICF